MFLSDINIPFDDIISLHLGTEYLYAAKKNMDIAFRGGIQTSKMGYLGSMSAISLGFGVYLNKLEIDYALAPQGLLGMTHFMSFKLKFSTLSGDDAWKNKTKIRGSAKTVYLEAMKWFDAKVKSEKLNKTEQTTVLNRIREKFKPLGVDVSLVEKKLKGLKNARK